MFIDWSHAFTAKATLDIINILTRESIAINYSNYADWLKVMITQFNSDKQLHLLRHYKMYHTQQHNVWNENCNDAVQQPKFVSGCKNIIFNKHVDWLNDCSFAAKTAFILLGVTKHKAIRTSVWQTSKCFYPLCLHCLKKIRNLYNTIRS